MRSSQISAFKHSITSPFSTSLYTSLISIRQTSVAHKHHNENIQFFFIHYPISNTLLTFRSTQNMRDPRKRVKHRYNSGHWLQKLIVSSQILSFTNILSEACFFHHICCITLHLFKFPSSFLDTRNISMHCKEHRHKRRIEKVSESILKSLKILRHRCKAPHLRASIPPQLSITYQW